MWATIGHNHPAIVERLRRAGEKAFHFFSGMIPEGVAELARTLAHDWLPGDLKRYPHAKPLFKRPIELQCEVWLFEGWAA